MTPAECFPLWDSPHCCQAEFSQGSWMGTLSPSPWDLAHSGQHWLSGGTAGFGTPPRSMSAPGAALGLRPRRALSSDRGDFSI